MTAIFYRLNVVKKFQLPKKAFAKKYISQPHQSLKRLMQSKS